LHSFFYFRSYSLYLQYEEINFQLADWNISMKYITTYELKEKFDRNEAFQLVDTREAEKFAECHITTAINIPQIDLPDHTDLITRDMPVIIYCLYGVKSQAPYLYLTEKMKFRNIYILEGGIFQWATDIDPSLPVA
jgi:rhodanese-related sulfurtransferase